MLIRLKVSWFYRVKMIGDLSFEKEGDFLPSVLKTVQADHEKITEKEKRLFLTFFRSFHKRQLGSNVDWSVGKQ